MMRIYLAARYSRYREMQEYAEQLEESGHTITSRWIRGEHQVLDGELLDLVHIGKAVEFLVEDLADLSAADTLIAFTEVPRSETSRGGRHVEFGIAFATNKAMYVVGPVENLFYLASTVQARCDTLDELLACTAWQDAGKLAELEVQPLERLCEDPHG